MKPRRLSKDAPELPAVLALIQTTFAYMEGRINPPSSMHRLTNDSVARHADDGEIWVLGDRPDACVFLTPQTDAMYLGKLAVSEHARGTGMGRKLVDLAKARARALAKPCVRLESRIELTEIHAKFRAMGFQQTATNAHAGFDRPTGIIMECPV